jgi:hypothetical protein
MAPRGEVFLRPRFERALLRSGGAFTWDDVLPRLLDGRAQYWQTDDERGAIITEILRYPRLSVIAYWLVAGELGACNSLVPIIEDWARSQGCIRAIGLGRPGFERFLGPSGVYTTGTGYAKELIKRGVP